MSLRRAAVVAVLFGLAAAVVPALPAHPATQAGFPQGPPNDPGYNPAEQGGQPTCASQSANNEQHYFYSFMPQCTPNAKDPEGAAGMSIDKAWANYTTGDSHVLIAYVEGGINWQLGDAADLVNKVFLNTGELPLPEDTQGHTHPNAPHHGYDLNGDGVVSAADYANDPRVHDTNGNGYIDPEDLIATFSTWCNTGGTWHQDPVGCRNADNDHNGFAHDISGWDFYDHQNDPATADSTYGHANSQMRQAAAQTNNGILGAGVCPKCQILPVKAGAEALDRTDDLAQAWLYAARMGTKVIVSVTADLGYSSFMRQTVEQLWRQGVVMVEASNDFDSTDHQGGMFWPHVLPGNGLVSNTQDATGNTPAGNAATTTYRERSNYTSWGTHNMFSVATSGGTTSESTPTVGGVMGLVLSEGEQAAKQHKIGAPLSGPEAVQVVRATASRVTDPTLGWPGSPGDWNLQYGYGRPNVYAAMQAIDTGVIPPVAWINSPDWYSLYDPTASSTVAVSGHVEAPRSGSYTWALQYAPGPQPTSSQWISAASGQGTTPLDGTLGQLDLSQIPKSFWKAPYALSTTKALETNEQYTVTIRLRVWDAQGRIGEERRAVAVHHDKTLRPGFPIKLGSSGESQPALADLQGRGHLAIVFGDADGKVHAVDGLSGQELPGWPVKTNPTVTDGPTPGITPGHEPVVSPVAVGDLSHNGQLSVVATSTTGRTYVWNAQGQLLAGWPKSLDAGAVTPAIPRPKLSYTRLPHQGATASPVLYDLTGTGQLDIVQAAWDGNVYAWAPNGAALAGWPVHVTLGPSYQPPSGYVLVNDAKIDSTPAVAFLEGPGKPDLVVRSQYSDVLGAGIQPNGFNHVFAFRPDGTAVPGWPVSLQALVMYYGSAQEFITEAANAPATADVDGTGTDSVATGPDFSATYLLRGSGQIRAYYGPQTFPLSGPDTPVSFTTSGAFGRFGPAGTLAYAESGPGGVTLADALLMPGSGSAIATYERGYNTVTGAAEPGFPTKFQGLDFLSAPVIADVTGDGVPEVIDGGDSSTLHAYRTAGAMAAGFPKFTTGWVLFSPSAGDLSSNGHTDLVTVTREGYLMAWSTPGIATGNAEWWSYHHDEWRTGRYGTDTRPPGVLRGAAWVQGSTTVSFTAPGGDWYDGTVDHYLMWVDGAGPSVLPASVAAGGTQTLPVPANGHQLRIQAVDGAGNLSPPLTLGTG